MVANKDNMTGLYQPSWSCSRNLKLSTVHLYLVEALQNLVLPQSLPRQFFGMRQEYKFDIAGVAFTTCSFDDGASCFRNVTSTDVTLLLSNLKIRFIFSIAEAFRLSIINVSHIKSQRAALKLN